MDFAIYYTIGAIVLYGATSWILDRVEEARGERLKYRNVIFFIILFVLAMLLMEVINPPQQTAPSNQDMGTSSPVQ